MASFRARLRRFALQLFTVRPAGLAERAVADGGGAMIRAGGGRVGPQGFVDGLFAEGVAVFGRQGLADRLASQPDAGSGNERPFR